MMVMNSWSEMKRSMRNQIWKLNIRAEDRILSTRTVISQAFEFIFIIMDGNKSMVLSNKNGQSIGSTIGRTKNQIINRSIYFTLIFSTIPNQLYGI